MTRETTLGDVIKRNLNIVDLMDEKLKSMDGETPQSREFFVWLKGLDDANRRCCLASLQVRRSCESFAIPLIWEELRLNGFLTDDVDFRNCVKTLIHFEDCWRDI